MAARAARKHGSPTGERLGLYRFRSLAALDEIRILTLHGITRGTIECSIQHITVSAGGYQALSYVWGSEERKSRAIVRSAEGKGKLLGYIPLTANLQNALHDLWNAEQLQSKVFWIDQMCIDQGGPEKSHQVQLMGQIFENADTVITYVGRAEAEGAENEKEKRGFDLLQRLDAHFAANYEPLCGMADLREARKWKSQLPVLHLPEDIDERLKKTEKQGLQWLVEVAFGKWTTRLWMVQEQLLNKELVMLRGRHLLPWEAVAAVPALFFLDLLPVGPVFSFWKQHREGTTSGPWDSAHAVFWLWKMRKLRKTQKMQKIQKLHSTMTLLQNMACYDGLQCRDPRDRIFALLAISSDAPALRISPNYSDQACVVSTFLQTSVSILKTSNDLAFLAYACLWDNSSNQALPSWALYVPRPTEVTATLITFGVCSPHPSPLIDAPLSVRPDYSAITVKGCILDRISLSFPPLHFSQPNLKPDRWDEDWTRRLAQWLSNCTEILSQLGSTPATAASFYRALLADPTLSPTTEDSCSKMQNEAFFFWCCFRSATRLAESCASDLDIDVSEEIDRSDEVLESLAPLLISRASSSGHDLSPEEESLATELRQIMNIRGRSFGITKGKRIYNCMNGAKQGDAVAALEGADRLYTLRPVAGGYRLIGDAYVDGLMEGEAYSGLDPAVDHDIVLL
jgi:hypothetical protein